MVTITFPKFNEHLIPGVAPEISTSNNLGGKIQPEHHKFSFMLPQRCSQTPTDFREEPFERNLRDFIKNNVNSPDQALRQIISKLTTLKSAGKGMPWETLQVFRLVVLPEETQTSVVPMKKTKLARAASVDAEATAKLLFGGCTETVT